MKYHLFAVTTHMFILKTHLHLQDFCTSWVDFTRVNISLDKSTV